jgi:hypothetical protein
MKNLIYTSIFGISLLAQTSIAQYGIKGTFIDLTSNELYNDGAISDFYKPNNLSVNLACGTIADNLGNSIYNRGIFNSTDANGFLLSSKEYNFWSDAGPYQSQLNSISEVSAAKITCSGAVKLTPTVSDVLILQIDQLGNALKARKVDFGGLDEALCTRKSRNSANFFYTCGKSKNTASGATHFILMRHNSDGTTLNWSKSFSLNIPGWLVQAEATSVLDETNTGNVIVVGNYKNANGNDASKRSFIAKLTNAGVVKWIHTFAPGLYSELDVQSIRPTENSQAFVITGSAKQNATGRISTIILRVNTSSDLKPSIEFFNFITTPGFLTNPLVKQEGNDVVMQNVNGIIKYHVAATTYLANGDKQATQITCAADGKANLVKTLVNNTNSTFSAIDVVQNQVSGNGIAYFGSQKALLDPNVGLLQKGMLVKSTLGLQTSCSEQNELPSNTTIVSSSASLVFAFVNIGLAENVSYSSINGQIYSGCWNAFPISGARFHDGSEEDVVSTILPDPTLYPNPVAGTSTTLVVHAESNEKLQVNIFDMHGRLMLAKSIITQQGENPIELNLGTMEAGIYTIALQGKEQVNRFIKFVKQ